jgi:hypothetical protein
LDSPIPQIETSQLANTPISHMVGSTVEETTRVSDPIHSSCKQLLDIFKGKLQ